MNAAPLPTAIQAALLLLAGSAAAFDLRWRRIPNWLVVAGFVSGILLQIRLYGWLGLKAAALGFGLAVLVYLPLFLLRAMGGGDLKLMAAAGTLAGPDHWFSIFLVTAILGGVAAIVLLVWQGRLGAGLRNMSKILSSLARGSAPYKDHPEIDIGSVTAVTLPHGAVIAAGVFCYVLVLT